MPTNKPAAETATASPANAADDRLYNVALGLVPGIGGTLARQMLAYLGCSRAVFEQPEAKLLKIPGVGKKLISTLAETRKDILIQAEKALKPVEANGDELLFFLDDNYPKRLKEIDDAPVLLYKRGPANLDAEHAIAIVGTRKATRYGMEVTERIVEDLKQYDCLIVSGLAYGIDIAAHKAALKVGLPTVGVMANGFDRIYPHEHKPTAQQMLKEGALLTEHGYGVEAEQFHFPARNRIIAGLSEATIVVEAGAKGGALITAELAAGYNRDVLAVPGDINREASLGCNRLIAQNKAICYTRIEDLVEALNWDIQQAKAQKEAQLALFQADLSDEENRILTFLLPRSDVQIDELSRATQIPINKLASLLLQLEFSGLIRSLPGKKFCYAK